MGEIAHPAYREELEHLSGTLEVIAKERIVAENDRLAAEGSLSTARMYDPDALPLREMMYAHAVQTEKNLAEAAKKPYFTRIDFTEKTDGAQTYYIGKYGVYKTDSLEAEVIDWRAPVANLYYSGQIGPLKYEAPDGTVEGELTLKRQFGMDKGELTSIIDADIVSQDEFLQGVLGETTGDRLREIVTTIQAEQNYVIRYPIDRDLVVQGVAGSGKTTIALHRIAYLMYTYQERLRAENMLILAPNPLFLNYIAQVLPDLGVENVRQTTFQRLISDWLGGALPKIKPDMPMDEVLALDERALADYSRELKYKGSHEMLARLERWLDRYEADFVPDGDIMFGPVTIYKNEDLRKFLLEDEKPFPLARRLTELKKQLKLRVKAAVEHINNWYLQEFNKRLDALPKAPGDDSVRARGQKLYDSMVERQKATKEQGAKFPDAALRIFPDLNPVRLYARFLEAEGLPAPGKAVTREDIAPIAFIAMRAIELKKLDVRHVVIDEAQDFNAFEIELIRRACRGATFTIVGDLMQGICGYRGISGWDEITGALGTGCARHELVTSYRNTTEIMTYATRVLKNMPVSDLSLPKPVLRHGNAPEEIDVSEIPDVVGRWRASGLNSVAVVARSHETVMKLHAKYGWQVLDPQSEEYPAGVVLAPADAVKGLEFDGVIVADADARSYPARPLDARLLYVCLTRALHEMAVAFPEGRSPLIAG